ncbi:MAG: hypothetical protein LC667_06910 [Thioalkalivibrio sp.]|nr:hypothetical protein [Thioalkalivibrio sp.]
MKKFLVSTLATFVLVSFGSVFAQQISDNHQLEVTIPDVLMIRVVTSDNTAATVQFDYANELYEDNYFAALEADGAWLPPTGGNITDVEVLAIGGPWTVDVTTGDFALAGLAREDVRVTPTAGFSAFFLNDADDVASGSAGGGWTPLGISFDEYALWVDGDEGAGSDEITVTYSIFSN